MAIGTKEECVFTEGLIADGLLREIRRVIRIEVDKYWCMFMASQKGRFSLRGDSMTFMGIPVKGIPGLGRMFIFIVDDK